MDKYEPQSLQDLAVHKRKVDDVRKWLGEAFDEKVRSKHRVGLPFALLCSKPWLYDDAMTQRLLILTGPAGSAKTATLRVLAREMDFDIVEYKDNTNTTRFSTFSDEPSTCTFWRFLFVSFLRCRIGIADTPDAFATFLMRTGTYASIFTLTRRKLVLVEDLPNILHPTVRSRFHDALRAHVERASDVAPLVLVISDAGVSAEGGSNGSGRDRDLVIDVRTVVPPGLSSASLSTEIRFVHLYDFALFLIGPTDVQ